MKLICVPMMYFFIHYSQESDLNLQPRVDQDMWPGICRYGKKQSPININTYNLSLVKSVGLRLHNFIVPIKSMTMINDRGYRALITPTDGVNRYIIFDDYKANTVGFEPAIYDVANVHFHWGPNAFSGSEHAFNGQKYALEVHVPTYKRAYGSFESALTKVDGVILLGAVYYVGRHNKHFEPVVDLGMHITDENQTAASTTPIELNRFFPLNKEFVWYPGGYDIPPCDESHNYIVFTHLCSIGVNQIPFRNWYYYSGPVRTQATDSTRNVQQLNGRQVFKARSYRVSNTVDDNNNVYVNSMVDFVGK